jgi:hypothetical protein
MTPNYQWKWDGEEEWVNVYVNPADWSVMDCPDGYVYASRWSHFVEAEDIQTRPYPNGDRVNSPSHYGQGKIECIEYIEDFLTKEEFIGYLRGNIAKYMHRWRYKNGLEDLKKAHVYLNWLIEAQENAQTPPNT